jgi:glycosyltransferase involved in cell wall biosynthesis
LNIVYFSSIDWNHTWQRPQQLASRLARHGNLLYISPLGLRSVLLKDLRRVGRRIIFQLKGSRTIAGPLSIHTPLFYLPFPELEWAGRFNAQLLRRVITNWMERTGIHQPIFWVGSPSLAVVEVLKFFAPQMIVYDCLDNFPLFHKSPMHIVDAEQKIASQAYVVFATAAELYERMKLINQNTVLLPNAADYDHFAAAATQHLPPPPDLRDLTHPILGYIGEIASWFNTDLVFSIATQHPEWNIVLIGLVHLADFERIRHLPNVHYLGPKPYTDLPAYLNHFDVCLLPFRVNALTSAVNPVKLFEYLAAGKPVVSTLLKEVIKYNDILETVSATDFADAITRALNTNTSDWIEKRMAVARQNTWDRRIEEIVKILHPAMPIQPEPH